MRGTMYEVIVMTGEIAQPHCLEVGLFPVALSQLSDRDWLSAALGRCTGAARGVGSLAASGTVAKRREAGRLHVGTHRAQAVP